MILYNVTSSLEPSIADEWLAKQSYSIDHRRAMRTLIDRDLRPQLGAIPIADLEKLPAMILDALRKVERRGTLETTAKCRRLVSMIFQPRQRAEEEEPPPEEDPRPQPPQRPIPDDAREGGLLGLAFHPNWPATREVSADRA